MTAPHPVGTVLTGGFILVSKERREGKIHVRCPACRKVAWKHQSNLLRVKSCGCRHRAGISVTRRLERYRVTVEAARVAFATDTAYAIAMAREASRIQDRKSDMSAIVVSEVSGD